MIPVADPFMADAPVRRPGDFRRARNGTPYVSHPDGQLTKPKSKKDPGHIISLPYSRPSGFSKIIEDYYAIAKWTERQVCLGFAIEPWELVPQALTLIVDDRDTEEWRANADGIVAAAKRAAKAGLAADRGTHAHQLTEDDDEGRDIITRIEHGEELGLDAGVQRSLVDVWQVMLARDGIVILAVEMPVVNDTYRCAGTLDRVAMLTRELRFTLVTGEVITLPAGTILILDIKSGKRRLRNNGTVMYWHGYAVQVFLYGPTARPYDTETDTRGEWEWEIDPHWALIAHLDVLGALDGNPSCELVLVDIAAGREAADLCVAAKAWEARNTVFSVAQLDVPGDGSPISATPGTPDVEGEGRVDRMIVEPSPSTPVSPQATQSPAAVNAGEAGSAVPTRPPATIEERTEQLLADLFTPDPVVVAAVAVASDAVDAACNKPFTPDHTEALAWASQPAPAPLPALPADPDEGRTAGGRGEALLKVLEHEYNLMDMTHLDGRAWIERLTVEAQQANVGFHTFGGRRTERRYWIIKALVDLARASSNDDDVLRALVTAALDNDAPLDVRHSAGAVVGCMDAAAAQRFATLVDDYVGVTA